MINSKLKNHPGNYINKLKKTLGLINKNSILELITKINSLIGTGHTIFIAGNGGSATTSSHMACDLSKTILGKSPHKNTKRLKVISLNDNIPLMTAWANDEGYEYIFSEQLKNLGKAKDYLIIITGSGNSKNLLNLIETAKRLKIETFGIFGFDGGKAKKTVNKHILVPSNDYGIIEDAHMIINHLITDWLKLR